jgi:predicted transcriptional regulator of viral defense system
VVEQTLATYDSACLDIGLRTGVFDKLIEARHEKNVPSVQQLGKSLELDPAKLTPVLRYLSTHGWLYETKEGHYRITRLSLEFNGLGRKWAL